MFQAAYESAAHHPGVAWIVTLGLVVALAASWSKTSRFIRVYLTIFAIEIVSDAYFTGALAPKSVTEVEWKNLTAAITFVIVGDYRFFVLVERFAPPAAPPSSTAGPISAWLKAIPWAFTVPLTWTFFYETKLIAMPDLYAKFFVYEVMFVILAVVLRFGVLPRRLASTRPAAKAYVLRLMDFELAQYVLWALADVVIRRGESEPGYLLRIVPNVMYYGGFLLFAWRTAPADIRLARAVEEAHVSSR
jgi:hypothetical protein